MFLNPVQIAPIFYLHTTLCHSLEAELELATVPGPRVIIPNMLFMFTVLPWFVWLSHPIDVFNSLVIQSSVFFTDVEDRYCTFKL